MNTMSSEKPKYEMHINANGEVESCSGDSVFDLNSDKPLDLGRLTRAPKHKYRTQREIINDADQKYINHIARLIADELGLTARGGEKIESMEDLQNAEMDIGPVDLIALVEKIVKTVKAQ